MDQARLKSVSLFSGLTTKELARVAQSTEEVELRPGQKLARQGSFAYEFFVIESGEAEVVQDGRHIRDLAAGDFFGEIGLLQEQGRRTASVVAKSDMTAIVMTGPAFRHMARELPAVAEKIERRLRERLLAYP